MRRFIYRLMRGKHHLDDPVQSGRMAGMKVHQHCMELAEQRVPLIVDDLQLTKIINHVLPADVPRSQVRDWRAGFMEGWTYIFHRSDEMLLWSSADNE